MGVTVQLAMRRQLSTRLQNYTVFMGNIQTFGVAGAGVIGAGWAVRALAGGLHVLAWDPDRDS